MNRTPKNSSVVHVTTDPGFQQVLRDSSIFNNYCLTGRHPDLRSYKNLRDADRVDKTTQTKITKYFTPKPNDNDVPS
jgi:hypothetical protein